MAVLRIGSLMMVFVLAISHGAAAQDPAAAAPAVPPSLVDVARDVESTELRVRRRALGALREQSGPETLTLLALLVDDEDRGIREGAIEAITRIYVEPPTGERPGSVEGLFLVGPYHVTPWPAPAEAMRELTRALADEYPDIRRDAAYAVAIVAAVPVTDRVAFELVASLSDRDPAVRVAAARALGRLQVRAAGVPLVGRVNDEVLAVRIAAIGALGELRETQAVPALHDQFSFYVRGVVGRAAIDALGRIAEAASVPLFEAQTGSGYPAHRRAAYEGLARSGAAKLAADRIKSAMASERDARVRLAMAYALAASGDPLTPIAQALADSDQRPQALEYLVDLARTRTADVAVLLRDQEPVLRRHAAIALGFAGGPQATSALAAARQEPDAAVRGAIDVAQLRLRNP